MRVRKTAILAMTCLVLGGGTFQDQWNQQVRRYLSQAAYEIAEHPVRPSHNAMYGELNEGYYSQFTALLRANHTYYITGRCDVDCGDLDLELYNENWQFIKADKTPDDQPYLQVTPTATRKFTIRVLMESCVEEPCRWGVGIFE